jgi:hypothetical protein
MADAKTTIAQEEGRIFDHLKTFNDLTPKEQRSTSLSEHMRKVVETSHC